ncbi:MAG TPA: ubiquitin-like domain-containing protein, partial [Desulfosporosinus sp.]|nr:ubiquitin-like domain-containing protein [Desulfosporosinus sp.]
MFQLTRTQVLALVRRSRIAQMVIFVCAIFLIAAVTLVYNAKTIEAHIDGQTVRVTTIYGTVGQALAHSNLESYPEDIVNPSRDTLVTKGLKVEVTRSIPVHLLVDEQTFMTRTPAKTVGEALV